MATTQTEARARTKDTPKNTRQNEIIAVALCALGVLLALCLLSYRPNDPSWNAAGQAETRNLVGAVGANVASALFQAVGLAAYLLPLLLLAAAWRRFRTRRIRAPLSRVIGLITLVVAASALLALSAIGPLIDKSFRPGGVAGTLIAEILASGLNTVGASVLLIALALTGLLLATNFSMMRAYEWLVSQFGNRFTFFRTIPEKFHAWRATRREHALQRVEMRRAARAEREAVRAERREVEKSGAERVAEFMRETGTLTADDASAATAIRRNATAATTDATIEITSEAAPASTASAATLSAATSNAVSPEQPSVTKRSTAAAAGAAAATAASRSTRTQSAEDAEIEEMVRDAAVVRTEVEDAPARQDNGAAASRRAPRRLRGLSDAGF